MKYFKNFGTYLIAFIGAMWVGILAAAWIPIPIEIAFETNTLADRIIQGVLYIVVGCLMLFFSARTVGYKSREYSPIVTVVSMAAVFAVQQAVSPIFRHAEYISGGGSVLTKLIFLGNNPAFAEAPDFIVAGVPQWGYHVVMLAIALVFYLPAVLCGEYFGRKKREKDRRELTGEGKQDGKEQKP